MEFVLNKNSDLVCTFFHSLFFFSGVGSRIIPWNANLRGDLLLLAILLGVLFVVFPDTDPSVFIYSGLDSLAFHPLQILLWIFYSTDWFAICYIWIWWESVVFSIHPVKHFCWGFWCLIWVARRNAFWTHH